MAKERVVRITDHTVIDRAQIRRLIEAARDNGYAISDQEAVLGGSGVAAPVRDKTGEVVAALNIATISQRFDTRRATMIDAVIRHADELSNRLGYRKPKPEEMTDAV
jgi:DNA-binding IclR family transcriptional regulator